MIVKNINDLKKKVSESQDLQTIISTDPAAFFNEVEVRPPITNKYVFISVVGVVGLALFISLIVAAITVLKDPVVGEDANGNSILLEREVNQLFVAIASASIGALVGLLAPTNYDSES